MRIAICLSEVCSYQLLSHKAIEPYFTFHEVLEKVNPAVEVLLDLCFITKTSHFIYCCCFSHKNFLSNEAYVFRQK